MKARYIYQRESIKEYQDKRKIDFEIVVIARNEMDAEIKVKQLTNVPLKSLYLFKVEDVEALVSHTETTQTMDMNMTEEKPYE